MHDVSDRRGGDQPCIDLGWSLAPTVLGHAQIGDDACHHRVRHRRPEGSQGDLVREYGLCVNLAYPESPERAPGDGWLSRPRVWGNPRRPPRAPRSHLSLRGLTKPYCF